MTDRARTDLGVAVVVILVGAVFALEAWRIDPRSDEAVGPRFVPLFLALSMVVLGGGIGAGALRRSGRPAEPGFGFGDSDLARVAAVVGAGVAYVAAFWAIGYFGATILAMALALWVFGVRSTPVLVLLPIAAGIAYQFVFMGLMGLLDPRGALLDLRDLSRLVTPG